MTSQMDLCEDVPSAARPHPNNGRFLRLRVVYVGPEGVQPACLGASIVERTAACDIGRESASGEATSRLHVSHQHIVAYFLTHERASVQERSDHDIGNGTRARNPGRRYGGDIQGVGLHDRNMISEYNHALSRWLRTLTERVEFERLRLVRVQIAENPSWTRHAVVHGLPLGVEVAGGAQPIRRLTCVPTTGYLQVILLKEALRVPTQISKSFE